MAKKPFSAELYNNDDDAKDQFIEWLTDVKGYVAWVNPDDYGIDILAVKNAEQFQFEVEVKHNWKGADFPFSTVHFSARKLKFATNPERTFFIMFNHERSHFLSVSGQTILESSIVIKDTMYTEDEEFIAVPKAECFFRKFDL